MAYPDVVGVISQWLTDNKDYTGAQKQQLLEDFTEEFGYSAYAAEILAEEPPGTPKTRVEYANWIYFRKTKEAVEVYRRRQAQQALAIDEVDVEE